jgi:hypothetical protein
MTRDTHVATHREMERLRSALSRGVAQARTLGGRVQAAVWIDGWTRPVVVGDDLGRRMRMWSMAKPVEAIAVLQRAARVGVRPTAGFRLAMDRALRRSENCAARRMVLELEHLTGGPAAARAAFASVLSEAGAHPTVATETDGPSDQSTDCEAFLSRESAGLSVPDREAVLFGTSLWRVDDAVRFAHALADGTFGVEGASVLLTMTKPKLLSQEAGAVFTASPLWGAGTAFRRYRIAYKAGWGGATRHQFLAGQFAVVYAKRRRAAVAAIFHPSVQPRIDDPGETTAPHALEAIFAAVARTFRASADLRAELRHLRRQ